MVDTLKGSRDPNMKELRPQGGHMRVLFAFDPRRMAILLMGGDKGRRWSSWYAEAIPAADALMTSISKHFATKEQSHDCHQGH